MALIRANRESIDDRFSVLGFTVRTENPLYEIGLATDPELLKVENQSRRNAGNFFSSTLLGVDARRQEEIYLVPPNVVSRFVGQPRLYFGLATYLEGNRSQPASVKTPDRGSMYVNLSGLTERGLRRTARTNGTGSYGNGNGRELTWGGDALASGSPSKSNGNGTANHAAPNGDSALYSDGYSDDLWQPSTGASATAPVNGTGGAATNGNVATTAPVAAQAWSRGLTADEFGDDNRGIEGPIPDRNPADDPTFSTPQSVRGLARPLNAPAPEYPQAARFVPAHAGNFRATTTPRTIERIVIHITDGGANINGTIGWFQDPKAGVSAHYVIGQDGEIVQMVRHNDVAWHARSANRTSIGIEHVANTRGLNPTPAQMCASAALVTWLCDQYGIAADRTHILGHSEADTATTHTGCPNAVWDWAYYMEMITTRTCFEPTSTTANTLGYGGAQRMPARTLQRSNASNGRHPQAYARPLLVEPYNQPSSWWDALTTQLGHFARGAMWFLGVSDTTQPPYSAICQVRRPDGTAEGAHSGTAFFIGPRLLLTAAHVVDGVSELIIVPGKNGGGVSAATEPFGRFHVTQFRKHASYGINGSDNDMALICVPAANAVSAPNYFALVEELTQSRPEGVVVSGYAAWWQAVSDIEIFVNNNIDQNRQHAHGGYIRELPTDGTFTYDLQTLAGTSGSPVYWIEGDTQPSAHLVGVHVAANDNRTNLGCRITQEKLRWIRETAAAWGQTLTFSLSAKALEDAATSIGDEDPDTIGISEDEPVPAESMEASAQAMRARALNAPAPDYPAASRFVPAHARNFTVGRRRDRVLDRIVVHITAGGPSINGTIGWFQNGSRVNERTGKDIRSSSHYIVGRDGEVVQMVRNADTAHHASTANSRSIGIEHNANKPTRSNPNDLPPTQAQYEASARLVAWLCQQYNLPTDREHIVGHMQASPSDNHDCPSSYWDWDTYMQCVQLAAQALAQDNSTGAVPTSQALRGRASVRAQELITPYYDPSNPISALMCTNDAFSVQREEWYVGVDDTSAFPHSAICHLRMTKADGKQYTGTGFYIGRNRILTCAHNLHRMSTVQIIPGRNGAGTTPFGEATIDSTQWRIAPRYSGDGDWDNDLAVIDNAPIEAPNGAYFSFMQATPGGTMPLAVCGYSSGSNLHRELNPVADRNKQHLHGGHAQGQGTPDTIDYDILAIAGASGSPVYTVRDEGNGLEAFVCGVHVTRGPIEASGGPSVNRGCFITPTKIDWIEGRATTFAYRGNAARTLSSDAADFPVALIPQPDKNACWAASMAMLLSYRRNASFAPETLANEVGASLASAYNWDLLQAVRTRYGFEMIAQPSNASVYHTPQQWAEWLNQYGPLWVVIVGAPHAVVIGGIKGDLARPETVQVKVLNPWDTRVAFDNDPVAFNPRNGGYEDWLSFNQFAADFGNMAEADYGNWRVLYLPAVAASAQSLGAARSRQRFSTAQGEDAHADDSEVFELLPPPPPVVRELAVRALDGGATVAIGSTIVGAVMERLVNDDGDIDWELDQLRGYKHPNDIAPSPPPPTQDGKVLRLDDWPKVNVGFIVKDEISAGFEINWQHNGKSVGNVMISNIATNDAVGWGLSVKAKIMDDNIVYPRANPTFAALRIRFEYRFTHMVKGDKIAIRDIRLYGDGGYSDDGHWEQS